MQFHKGPLVIKTDTLLGKDDSPYLHNSPNLLKDWERLRLNFCTVDNPLADLEVVVESENLVLLTEATTDSVKKKIKMETKVYSRDWNCLGNRIPVGLFCWQQCNIMPSCYSQLAFGTAVLPTLN